MTPTLTAARSAHLAAFNTFEAFSYFDPSKYTRNQNGNWVSPGGRVMSNEQFQAAAARSKMAGSAGGGDGKTTAQTKSPKKAAAAAPTGGAAVRATTAMRVPAAVVKQAVGPKLWEQYRSGQVSKADVAKAFLKVAGGSGRRARSASPTPAPPVALALRRPTLEQRIDSATIGGKRVMAPFEAVGRAWNRGLSGLENWLDRSWVGRALNFSEIDFSEIDKFAFDPNNYTQLQTGNWKSRGGRVLSDTAYQAASRRAQESASAAQGPKKPPMLPRIPDDRIKAAVGDEVYGQYEAGDLSRRAVLAKARKSPHWNAPPAVKQQAEQAAPKLVDQVTDPQDPPQVKQALTTGLSAVGRAATPDDAAVATGSWLKSLFTFPVQIGAKVLGGLFKMAKWAIGKSGAFGRAALGGGGMYGGAWAGAQVGSLFGPLGTAVGAGVGGAVGGLVGRGDWQGVKNLVTLRGVIGGKREDGQQGMSVGRAVLSHLGNVALFVGAMAAPLMFPGAAVDSDLVHSLVGAGGSNWMRGVYNLLKDSLFADSSAPEFATDLLFATASLGLGGAALLRLRRKALEGIGEAFARSEQPDMPVRYAGPDPLPDPPKPPRVRPPRIPHPLPPFMRSPVVRYPSSRSATAQYSEPPFETFAFDPNNYVRTPSGSYKHKTARRYLSAGQFQAAVSRLKKGGTKKPAPKPSLPPTKPTRATRTKAKLAQFDADATVRQALTAGNTGPLAALSLPYLQAVSKQLLGSPVKGNKAAVLARLEQAVKGVAPSFQAANNLPATAPRPAPTVIGGPRRASQVPAGYTDPSQTRTQHWAALNQERDHLRGLVRRYKQQKAGSPFGPRVDVGMIQQAARTLRRSQRAFANSVADAPTPPRVEQAMARTRNPVVRAAVWVAHKLNDLVGWLDKQGKRVVPGATGAFAGLGTAVGGATAGAKIGMLFGPLGMAVGTAVGGGLGLLAAKAVAKPVARLASATLRDGTSVSRRAAAMLRRPALQVGTKVGRAAGATLAGVGGGAMASALPLTVPVALAAAPFVGRKEALGLVTAPAELADVAADGVFGALDRRGSPVTERKRLGQELILPKSGRRVRYSMVPRKGFPRTQVVDKGRVVAKQSERFAESPALTELRTALRAAGVTAPFADADLRLILRAVGRASGGTSVTTFREFETFAFDPNNYVRTPSGSYKHKTARRYLSAGQFQAAVSRLKKPKAGSKTKAPTAAAGAVLAVRTGGRLNLGRGPSPMGLIIGGPQAALRQQVLAKRAAKSGRPPADGVNGTPGQTANAQPQADAPAKPTAASTAKYLASLPLRANKLLGRGAAAAVTGLVAIPAQSKLGQAVGNLWDKAMTALFGARVNGVREGTNIVQNVASKYLYRPAANALVGTGRTLLRMRNAFRQGLVQGAIGVPMAVVQRVMGLFNAKFRMNVKKMGGGPAAVLKASAIELTAGLFDWTRGAVLNRVPLFGRPINWAISGVLGKTGTLRDLAMFRTNSRLKRNRVSEVRARKSASQVLVLGPQGGKAAVSGRQAQPLLDEAAAAVRLATQNAAAAYNPSKPIGDPANRAFLATAKRVLPADRHAALIRAAAVMSNYRSRRRDRRGVSEDLLRVLRSQTPDGRFAESSDLAELVAGVKELLAAGGVPADDRAILVALGGVLAHLAEGDGEVKKFSWKEGERGGRYWLPAGEPDIPANRLYGTDGEAAAQAELRAMLGDDPPPRDRRGPPAFLRQAEDTMDIGSAAAQAAFGVSADANGQVNLPDGHRIILTPAAHGVLHLEFSAGDRMGTSAPTLQAGTVNFLRQLQTMVGELARRGTPLGILGVDARRERLYGKVLRAAGYAPVGGTGSRQEVEWRHTSNMGGRRPLSDSDYQSLVANLPARMSEGEVKKFSWKEGERGGHYWLPQGKPDSPEFRLYGQAGRDAEEAAKRQSPRPGLLRRAATAIGNAFGPSLQDRQIRANEQLRKQWQGVYQVGLDAVRTTFGQHVKPDDFDAIHVGDGRYLHLDAAGGVLTMRFSQAGNNGKSSPSLQSGTMDFLNKLKELVNLLRRSNVPLAYAPSDQRRAKLYERTFRAAGYVPVEMSGRAIIWRSDGVRPEIGRAAMQKGLEAVPTRMSEVVRFGWKDWKPDGPGHMKSPGGRRLSNAVFQKLSKGTATPKVATATPKVADPVTRGVTPVTNRVTTPGPRDRKQMEQRLKQIRQAKDAAFDTAIYDKGRSLARLEAEETALLAKLNPPKPATTAVVPPTKPVVPPLTGTAATTFARAQAEYPAFRDKFLTDHGTTKNGQLVGVTLNTDEWRGYFPEYTGTNAADTHEAASYLNDRLFQEALTQLKGKGNNRLVVLAGGGGSGKGAASKLLPLDEYPIRLDQVSGDFDKLMKKFDQGKANGFQPEYTFIDRSPEQAWAGVVSRAANGRKKGGVARTVPLEIALRANLDARAVAIRVLKERPDIPVAVVDNNGGPLDAKMITGGPLDAKMITDRQAAIRHLERQSHDYQTLLEKLRRDTLSRPDLDPDIRAGLVPGAGPAAEVPPRPAAGQAGSRRTPDAGGAGVSVVRRQREAADRQLSAGEVKAARKIEQALREAPAGGSLSVADLRAATGLDPAAFQRLALKLHIGGAIKLLDDGGTAGETVRTVANRRFARVRPADPKTGQTVARLVSRQRADGRFSERLPRLPVLRYFPV